MSKAQQLSRHYGFETEIYRPLTLVEIVNQHERENEERGVEVIGFRKTGMEN